MSVRATSLLVRLSVLALAGASLSAACSFPDYGFTPEQGPAGATGSAGLGGTAHGGSGGSGGTGGNDGTSGATTSDAGAGGTATDGGAAGSSDGAGSGGQAPTAAPRCRTLFEADSSLPSGAYPIDPDGDGPGEPFDAYCDMDGDGGGWTLIGSFSSATFNATLMGSSSEPCYDTPCVNRAYATLLLEQDVRIDAASVAIAGNAVDSTAVFLGIDSSSSGKTLRSIFTGAEPAYVEGPATTVTVEWFNGLGCGTWANYGGGLCEAGVHVVFRILSGCPDGPLFALGVANNFDGIGTFCDGWPQLPGANFPEAIRIWAR